MHYDPRAILVSHLAALYSPSMSFFKFHIFLVLILVSVVH